MRELILLNLSLLILLIVPTSHVFASNSTTSSPTLSPQLKPIPTEQQPPVNFTLLFSTTNFGHCIHRIICPDPVEVPHQAANLLVLRSNLDSYPRAIWSAVVMAKSYGYKLDNVVYAAWTEPNLLREGEVYTYENVIVTMSK